MWIHLLLKSTFIKPHYSNPTCSRELNGVKQMDGSDYIECGSHVYAHLNYYSMAEEAVRNACLPPLCCTGQTGIGLQ